MENLDISSSRDMRSPGKLNGLLLKEKSKEEKLTKKQLSGKPERRHESQKRNSLSNIS